MAQDIYTIENDFTNEFGYLDLVQHKQVIYKDHDGDRLFQKIILEARHWDMRSLMENIKQDKHIMDLLHWVGPFSLYGFLGGNIAITFKKDLQFPRDRALKTIQHILDRYNSRTGEFNY